MASLARPLNDIFQNTTIDNISEVGHGIDSLPPRAQRSRRNSFDAVDESRFAESEQQSAFQRRLQVRSLETALISRIAAAMILSVNSSFCSVSVSFVSSVANQTESSEVSLSGRTGAE
jgi:hypothetical protein